ncbi:acyl-CoA dehydrogenase family protein [Desertimonas flava]|uniref:acyl-CoA dehydrogenase family protein n=1 Tax=Desertimonas flava TaxID=2064846 RepID=UPI000E34C700|nr:acyl-CoA dehydrogenase family protein [Desertimonas flava]
MTETVNDLAAFAGSVRSWLDDNWDPGIPRRDWIDRVIDAGYAVPTWPTEWFGLGLDGAHGRVVADEFRRVGAPGSRQDVHNLWANTLLAYGTDQLKHQLVRPLLHGDVAMCLLYSEPGAGSDLAGLQTRADRDGDEFVVTGQKVWTSGAKEAEYGMLVARTDWDVPKHRGISFFFFPMRQPGVEVRPIRQITGESHFNEVFIDRARVPAANLLGGLGDGWRVLQTALAYERSVMGDMARGPRKSLDTKFASPDEGSTASSSAEVDLGALAREVGRADDPVLRQAIVRVHTLRTVNKWNAQRAKAQLKQGESSPILSLGKLAMSRILHEGAHVQRLIVGADALLDGLENPRGDAANFLSLNAYFTSIGGGTDQIQRNIIGERVLGLPKEPEVDRDIPFRDVQKATVTR